MSGLAEGAVSPPLAFEPNPTNPDKAHEPRPSPGRRGPHTGCRQLGASAPLGDQREKASDSTALPDTGDQ